MQKVARAKVSVAPTIFFVATEVFGVSAKETLRSLGYSTEEELLLSLLPLEFQDIPLEELKLHFQKFPLFAG
jgi:hypothetical protein